MSRIVMIGAGNLATQVAIALQKSGNIIDTIYSRTTASALQLAQRLHCDYTTQIEKIPTDADLYLFAVKDSALQEVIKQMPCTTGVWAHTAGSIPMDIFAALPHQAYGVFYPLQTFSKERAVDMSVVPFFIEGVNTAVVEKLTDVAKSVSSHVHEASSVQRRGLHLAAVFACNFTNHMYHIAANLLAEQELPFEALLPLITESAAKVATLSPQEAQTGPAVRYDENVITKQTTLLQDTHVKELYTLLSNNIYRYSQHKNREIV